MTYPVAAAFTGDGHFCSQLPAIPPGPPPPTCQVEAIVFDTAAFSGGSALCSGCEPPPPPPPPGCACNVAIGLAPQLASVGTAAALVGPYSVQLFEVTGTFYAIADPSVSGTINDPMIQPINALCSFTPRLPAGYQAFIADYLVSNAYNAQQIVSMIGNPIMGVWWLNFYGQITGEMPFDVSPAALQIELESLSNIGTGNVNVVAGINPQSYDIEWTGTLGNTAMLPLVPTWSDLIDVNGYDCTITVVTTAVGSPQITAPTSISIPTRQARIMAGVLSTIDYVDTPGVQLVSNSPLLALPSPWYPLIYDVAFSAVTFNDANQVMANFAFVAPPDNTTVCISDPALEKLNYAAPITDLWVPQAEEPYEMPGAQVVTLSGWRQRAAQQKVRLG